MADIPIYKLTQPELVIDATLIKATPFVTGYTFGGTVTTIDVPLTEGTVNAFYFAVSTGTYTNFGNLLVSEPGFIYYDVIDGYSFQAFSFSGSGIAGVSSVNSITGAVVITTDDIPEGINNKYMTGTIPTDINQLLDSSNLIGSKAPISNVLTLNNVTPYTPTTNYHPATKIFVESAIATAVANISHTDTADLAYNVDWGTATLPPFQQDPALIAHMEDLTIHFLESDIDKYTRGAIDTMIGSLDTRLDIIEEWLNSPGNTEGVTQALFFSHIYNLSVHFTKEEMYDYIVNNISDLDDAKLLAAVGDRIYPTSHYITSGETVTLSLDYLDEILYGHISNQDIHFTLNDIGVYCTGGVRT